jgi:hypothetical protein
MESMGKYVHDIHDYIRDNTKISNEDKSFFIAIIIIASKALCSAFPKAV